jgi:hypothetical protein
MIQYADIIIVLYGVVVTMTLGFGVVLGTCSGFQLDVGLPIPNRCKMNIKFLLSLLRHLHEVKTRRTFCSKTPHTPVMCVFLR